MKHVATVVVTLILMLFGIGTAFPQNVSVTDYSVPVSTAQNMRVDLNYNYSAAGSKTTSNDGTVGLIYRNFYESLPYAFSVDFLGSGSTTRDAIKDENITRYATDAAGRVKKYVWEDKDFFGSVALHASYTKDYKQVASDVTIGVGYGRFINATALRKAVRIEDFLLEEGIISGRLPKETMIEIGHIIEREPQYKEQYGSAKIYKKWWYEDIEKEIKKSGMLKGDTIGATGILRIEEVLFQEVINERYYGYDGTIGVKYDMTMSDPDIKRPKPGADISLRYSRPISWSTQINERLGINTPMSGDFGKTYSLIWTSDFIYELTNRIDFNVRYLLKADKPIADEKATFSHSFSPAFIFYVENKVNLTVSASLDKAGEGDLLKKFVLTLNYKIL